MPLIEHFGHDFNVVETVKTGDELKLGKTYFAVS